jgi:predicted nucleotidyltransferase
MTDRIYSLEEIKRIVAPIAVKYDVDRVFLFGSYARGEADGSSDLDFVIDKGRIAGLRFAGMLGDLQERFNKNVDLLTSAGIAGNRFRQRLEQDMVMVYEH